MHSRVNILVREYPSLDLDFLNQIQNGDEQFAAFFLFMGTSPNDRKRKYIEIKEDSKIKQQTILDRHQTYTESMPLS
jgi:hypothetical protein